MERWTRKVGNATQNEISRACANSGWQEFRLSLKGTPTENKLDKLDEYLRKHKTRYARVRVDNYMNSLLRGACLRRLPDGTLEVLR